MSVSVSVTARHVAAAALVGAVALPASAVGHDHDRGRAQRQHVVISAVQYDSPGRDNRSNRSLNKEWVDVTNTSRQDVNLEGWTLSDEDGHTYTFHHYRLEGRSTVRIHACEGRDSAQTVRGYCSRPARGCGKGCAYVLRWVLRQGLRLLLRGPQDRSRVHAGHHADFPWSDCWQPRCGCSAHVPWLV
ncbi:lamin tail domain-containing protein [Streptomyces sp. NPDC004561]